MAAMAHGVAVTTTEGRLSESFWRESDAIAVAPAGDSAALLSLVEDLVHHPARRRQMALSGRVLYDQRFSLSRVIDALRVEACGAVC